MNSLLITLQKCVFVLLYFVLFGLSIFCLLYSVFVYYFLIICYKLFYDEIKNTIQIKFNGSTVFINIADVWSKVER